MMNTKRGRILSIDYGRTRVGLAATDPLQIIVSGIGTIESKTFRDWLTTYLENETVVKIVFGKPVHKDGNPTFLWKDIQKEMIYIRKQYPEIFIDHADESFTSSEARSIIFQSGMKKKKRRDKKTVDKVSAVLILQRYLGHI